MRLVVKYVKGNPKTGSWTYRREIPEKLREVVGKREFKKKLGNSEQEALRSYQRYHSEVESTLASAKAVLAKQQWSENQDRLLSPRQAFEIARSKFIELGFDPDTHGIDPDSDEEVHRDVLLDAIAAKYPKDPETAHPIGVTPVDTHLARLLSSHSPVKPPAPTFLDAVQAYLEFKAPNLDEGSDREKRIRRLADTAIKAWGKDKKLTDFIYQDGLTLKAYYEKHTKNKPASLRRLFNDYKAIVNHAKTVFSLPSAVNPFAKIPFKEEGRAKDRRRSLSVDEIKAIRTLVLAKAARQPQLIWRLLEGTGCRPKEVIGLERQDIVLDGGYPHLNVTPNKVRRLKTANSERMVPLVGDTLQAAKEALENAPGDPDDLVFPQYDLRKRGADALSNYLMKFVRDVTRDRKAVVYSLRHTMKDRFRLAGIDLETQYLVLGHGKGSIASAYGGQHDLELAYKAMERVLNRGPGNLD